MGTKLAVLTLFVEAVIEIFGGVKCQVLTEEQNEILRNAINSIVGYETIGENSTFQVKSWNFSGDSGPGEQAKLPAAKLDGVTSATSTLSDFINLEALVVILTVLYMLTIFKFTR